MGYVIALLAFLVILLSIGIVFLWRRFSELSDFAEELQEKNEDQKFIMKEFSVLMFSLSKSESTIAKYEPLLLEAYGKWKQFFADEVNEMETEYQKNEKQRLQEMAKNNVIGVMGTNDNN